MPIVRFALMASLLLATPAGARALRSSRPAPPRTASLGFAPGVVLVVQRDDLPLRLAEGEPVEAGEPSLGSALARLGIARARRVGRPAGKWAASILALESDRADFDPRAAADALRATGRFRAVCPNYRFHVFATLPNDTYLDNQWSIQDPGDVDVDLPEAWDLEKGGPATVIGIMDTGVDLGHPDLASKIWTNPGEVPGDHVDNDGNGFIDDLHGWDFGLGNADPNPAPVFDAYGIDEGFHGTFVAGIAAAATNNAEGIAGAGWNCRILPLKVTDDVGDITAEAIAAAFEYAADQHVKVLNMSFGGPGDPGVPEFFQALVDMADSAGVLCVAAAGNDGSDTPTYPAACDRVLAVAATDFNDQRADFSNWGAWVDVGAPGASMFSCLCRNYVIDDFSQIFYLYLFGWDGETPYMFGDGTSFAAPLASGVCGLVRNHFPAFSPEQTIARILSTGDSLAYNLPIGPKLNAYRAVSAPITAVGDAAAAPLAFARIAPNPFRASTVLRFTLPAAGPARLTIFDCAGRRVRALADGDLEAGPHAIPWDGASDAGAPLGSGIYFAQLESRGGILRQKLVRLR
jgi:subtilisin family serine protease